MGCRPPGAGFRLNIDSFTLLACTGSGSLLGCVVAQFSGYIIESRYFSVVLWLSSGFQVEFHLCSLIDEPFHTMLIKSIFISWSS